jgi:hypothetical protein
VDLCFFGFGVHVFDDSSVRTDPFGYVVRTFCNVLVDGDAEYGVLVRSGEGVR